MNTEVEYTMKAEEVADKKIKVEETMNEEPTEMEDIDIKASTSETKLKKKKITDLVDEETTMETKKSTNKRNKVDDSPPETDAALPDDTKPAKKLKKDWNARLDECKAFLEKSGHCKIPTNYKANRHLGIWVQETRRNFKLMMTGKKPRVHLTDEQIEQLNDIEFHWGFTPDPNAPESDASWETNFTKLVKYKDANGNFDVPMESESFVKLATWTRVQRNQYNLRATKRKCTITKERIQKLDGIHFDWKGERKINA